MPRAGPDARPETTVLREETPTNSSRDRRSSARLRAFRAALAGMTTVSPWLASRAAGALFRLPPGRGSIADEEHALQSAQAGRLRTARGDRIATWRWGEGPPVLLVHGWGSRGARLASFVPPLVEAGFSALTFDAPGHGVSSGRLSSAPQFVAAVEAMAVRFGPFSALIAHSMGGCAAALAMRNGVTVDRAVFVAPAANPGDFSHRFAEALGLPEHVMDRMRSRFERKFGFRWDEFDVPRAAGRFTTPLLVFHDAEDREVPWSDGDAIARSWPGARLVTTHGLGHKRIVQDTDVVRAAVSFLSEAQARPQLSGLR